MKQIQANRLVALMNTLQSIPKHLFDINHWSDSDLTHSKATMAKALDCGTSACAVGWAVIGAPIWHTHFKFEKNGNLEAKFLNTDGTPFNDEFDAVALFLGVSIGESNFMFAPSGYGYNKVTKAMVLNHCKTVLDNHGFVWG